MERRIIDTITIWTGAFVLPLVAIAYLSGGIERASGAAAGAALAFVNWLVLRFVAAGLMRRGDRGHGTLMSVLVAKIGFVLAGAAVMLRVFDPTGLLIGVSVLVLGMFGGALHAHFAAGPSIEMDDSTASLAGASERD